MVANIISIQFLVLFVMQVSKETLQSSMNANIDHSHMNGNHEVKSKDNVTEASVNEHELSLDRPLSGDCSISGEALIKHVDHIYLSGEEEEKR